MCNGNQLRLERFPHTEGFEPEDARSAGQHLPLLKKKSCLESLRVAFMRKPIEGVTHARYVLNICRSSDSQKKKKNDLKIYKVLVSCKIISA